MRSIFVKNMMRSRSLFIIFFFSMSLLFGVLAQATTPSSQTVSLLSNSYPGHTDPGIFTIGSVNEKNGNSIMLDSQSNTAEISAKVYVKHYHRRDGTPVRSHYRRDPR
jgi:hypothetical protein